MTDHKDTKPSRISSKQLKILSEVNCIEQKILMELIILETIEVPNKRAS